MIILFVLLTSIPLLVSGFISYKVMRDEIMALAERSMAELVQTNSSVLDARFRDIADAALLMNVDGDICDVFSALDPSDPYALLVANRKLTATLQRYFGRFPEIYSVHLVTSYFRFGEEDKNFYPKGSFVKSEAYAAAEGANGALAWMPTYDYVDMFGLDDIFRTIRLDYTNVFSAVQHLNLATVKAGTIRSLPSSIERPVLVINFREDFLHSAFLSPTTPYPDFYRNYRMLTTDGRVIADGDKTRLGTVVSEEWLSRLGKSPWGTLLTRIDGKENVVCYAVSGVTGWVSAFTVSPTLFTSAILGPASKFVLLAWVFAVLVTAFLSITTSRVTYRRIYGLLEPIEKIGTGDFEGRIEYDPHDEFGVFYDRLNAVNENLRTLIHENYEVKLREREAALHMLTVQLNPHFLYNAINIINWTALRGDSSQTSSMLVGLARMIQYVSDNRSQTASLHEDLEWIRHYLRIMSSRFEGLFTVEIDVTPEVLGARVPKLLLQPLVENSILHGFKGVRSGGIIAISGSREGDHVVLCVEDNGCGMGDEEIRGALTGASGSIGLTNVDKRVKLLYGDRFGLEIHSQKGSGTVVCLSLPRSA